MEQWRDIEGYEGIYQVSSNGRVKRVGNGKERILKPSSNNLGYHIVTLSANNQRKTQSVHRLVALHFIPNQENKKTINHVDGDKSNNHVTNLEWNSYSENLKHAYKSGLNKGRTDSSIGAVKATNLKTGEEIIFLSQAHASKALNIHDGNIAKVVNGKRKSASNYNFERVTA
ncbi:NUMOD4 domain-containing protein [Cytobacillus oceanisediminis]|uniref:NUMOD4 domain-containing protein n=1 Tax=Cytobacillus oceanisediminis TaxID=665099 RepID=UPI0023DA5608|nr:NUMOD4 domain-containing protein [Cytobacillus oceanisediminis]MDF2036578.1 NUMOD4 domain-containing protein [Cytobacillus oceanisediminis]